MSSGRVFHQCLQLYSSQSQTQQGSKLLEGPREDAAMGSFLNALRQTSLMDGFYPETITPKMSWKFPSTFPGRRRKTKIPLLFTFIDRNNYHHYSLFFLSCAFGWLVAIHYLTKPGTGQSWFSKQICTAASIQLRGFKIGGLLVMGCQGIYSLL